MNIYCLNPRSLIPVDGPHCASTINYLCGIYEQRPSQEHIDTILAPIFIHHVRSSGIYVIDGHHRAGVAHLFNREVRGIFLNTFKDLHDAYELRDRGEIPHFSFDIDIEGRLPFLAKTLPNERESFALRNSIENFDDYADWLREGRMTWSIDHYLEGLREGRTAPERGPYHTHTRARTLFESGFLSVIEREYNTH